jgi:hypothetical protein
MAKGETVSNAHTSDQAANQRLRQLWQDGLASGSAGELDLTELRREARARVAAATRDTR